MYYITEYIICRENSVKYYVELNLQGENDMFEIKKPTSSNKTVRMPDELIVKLEKLAAQNDISFNQLVIQCCEYALKDLEKHKDDKKE